MADDVIASGNVGAVNHRLSYWARLTSRRSMATVLLDGGDYDDYENEFNSNQQIGSTLTINPSLITIANTSFESHTAQKYPLPTPILMHPAEIEPKNEQASIQETIEMTVGGMKNDTEIAVEINDDIAKCSSTIARNVDALHSSPTANDTVLPDPSMLPAISTTIASAPSESRISSHQYISMLNIFDLSSVGLSATLAIGIFLMVGYVIRHVAGPAAILSIIIATFCSYLAGSFYAELNCIAATPPMLSYPSTIGDKYAARTSMLLPAYVFIHVCIGELVAFIVGWNLMLDYIIGVALTAKGITAYLELLVFGNGEFLGAAVQPFTPKDWQILSSYFDFVAFFIPILIAGPLVLVIRRNTMLNILSVGVSLVTVVIVLIVSIFKANILNWTAKMPLRLANATTAAIGGDGGFFAFGLEGVLHGAAILTFLFVAFDAMVVNIHPNRKHKYIQSFKKTIPASVASINGLAFVCFLGISVAVTLSQPYFSLANNLQLPLAFTILGADWEWVTFIVLGCGIFGLLGSLFALMHAVLRVSHTMSADGLIFQLFGQFQSNNQPAIVSYLIFSLLAALFAGLCNVNQLINFLSMGALLLYMALTAAIIMVRYTPIVEPIDNSTESDRERNRHGKPSDASISLTSIMLILYCIFSASLCIFIQLVRSEYLVLSNGIILAIVPTFLILMGSLILGTGMQSIQPLVKRFKKPLNPMVPGLNIFLCTYLLTTFDGKQWLKLIIWMLLGLSMYFLCLRRNNQANGILPGSKNGGVVINGDYGYEEHEINVTVVTEVDETTISSEAIKYEESSPNDVSEILRSVTPDVIPKFNKHVSSDDVENNSDSHQSNSGYRISKVQNVFDEIISADDVKKTCIEMKEPDGKVYFVQQINQTSRSHMASYHKDESIALEILDSVIKSEDRSQYDNKETEFNNRSVDKYDTTYDEIRIPHDPLEHNAYGVDQTPKKIDTSEHMTIASDVQVIITDPLYNKTAYSSSSTTEPEYATIRRALSSPLPVLKLQSFDEIPTPLETKHVLNLEPQRENFKEHLSALISNQRDYGGQGASPPSMVTSNINTTMTAVRLTKSTNNLLDLAETTISEVPTALSQPLKVVSSEIPVAPRFDPILYNTHNCLKFPATAQSIENEFEKAFQRSLQRPKTFDEVQLKRVPRSETLNKFDDDINLGEIDETTRMTTIRDRLEKILCRGPPVRSSFRKSLSEPPPDYPDAPAPSNSEINDGDDHEIRRYRKPVKPFDTVHKQKVLFNDVLKSISPDIRTSLHRTDSSASIVTRTVTYLSPPSEDKSG